MRQLRSRLQLATVLALVSVAALSCSSRDRSEVGLTPGPCVTPECGSTPLQTEDGGAGQTLCAGLIEYDGHVYSGPGGVARRDPPTTGRLVEALAHGCDDGSGQDPDTHVMVAELVDIPLETAFLINNEIHVREGRELPAWARVWFEEATCTLAGEFDLIGDWLGVLGPHKPRFDGDIRLPYRLELHVTEGPEAYVGTTIHVHAGAATDPELGPSDVRTSLWEGGQVSARVRCVDGDFEAISLVVPPA